jgi:putative peptide zinc metalloprotease protein
MSTAASRAPLEYPSRAQGVDLLGATDAGPQGDRWLVCVGGSRYVQATPRLYLVLFYSDGKTSPDEIARRVSQDLGREMTADQVRWLIRERLVPAGLVSAGRSTSVTPTDGPGAVEPRTALLAIKHRLPILPYRVTAPLAGLLSHLYWPPAGVVLVAGAAGVAAWTYLGPGLSTGIHSLINHPELVLLLLVLDVPLRVFHELGHASAMRRAGVPFGEIGVALYVIVPVYYTDVTHSYRLGRGDRLRVDLGGMYFDCISMIGLFIAFRVTGQVVLVLAIVLIGLNMLREFTPFMRFDGYYLMADLVGVREPLSLLGPFIRDHLPWRRRPRTLGGLNRIQRVTLAVYFVVAAAFLLRPLLLLAVAGPSTIALFAQQGLAVLSDVQASWQAGDGARLVASGIKLLFWLLVPLGLVLFSAALLRMLWRAGTALVRRSRSRRAEPLVLDADGWDGEPYRTAAATPGREVEDDRDALRDRLDRLEAVFAQHLADLRALGGSLAAQAERAQRDWDAALEQGTSTGRQAPGDRGSDG